MPVPDAATYSFLSWVRHGVAAAADIAPGITVNGGRPAPSPSGGRAVSEYGLYVTYDLHAVGVDSLCAIGIYSTRGPGRSPLDGVRWREGMPTETLDQYTAAHQSMCGPLTSSASPAPDDAERYVSVSLDTGDIEPAKPIAGVDASQPLIDRIQAAFLQALEDNQGLAAADKLRATITSPRFVLFLGGLVIGVPVGVKNDVAGQLAFVSSLIEHVAPPLAEGIVWALDPQVWVTVTQVWLTKPEDDEEFDALMDQLPSLPPSITSVFVMMRVIDETASVLVPAILNDESLREDLMVETSRCLVTIATTSYVERLTAAGDDAFAQGRVVGEIIGELLGLAVITVVLGIIRLPTTLAEAAVEVGEKVKTFVNVVRAGSASAAQGIRAAARATEKAIAALIARIRLILRKFEARHAEASLIEHVPLPTQPAPGPAAVVQRKLRRRRLILPDQADKLLDKYAARVHAHHVLERVKRKFNRIVKITTKSDWEARLSQLTSHHVVEAQYFERFKDDFFRVGTFDDDGNPLLDALGQRIRMQTSDDMAALLVPSESHFGSPAPKSWTGTPIQRMEEVPVKGPDGSTVLVLAERVYQPASSFPHSLPSLHDLNNFLNDVETTLPGGEFRDVGELLDWHEYWYTRRFLDPGFDGRTPVSTPLPAPHERMGLSYQRLLRTILAELNRTRSELGLPIHPFPF